MKIRIFGVLVKYLIKCLIAILITGAALFTINVKGQSQQNGKTEIELVKTVNGDLQLIKHFEDDYVDNVSLKFKDKVLLEAPYQYISVKGKFGRRSQTLFLIFLGTDALSCIGKFVVVNLSGSKPSITQEFGNCSDLPKVAFINNSLTIAFPEGAKSDGKYTIGKKEVWQYKNSKLRKLQ